MLQRSMTVETPDHVTLSDADLLRTVHRLVNSERAATAALIAALGELDARRLYLAEGCSSLFTYCTHVLHLSEHAAYGRIEAARAARRWPVVLDMLADGSLHLTAIGLLSRHLTAENHEAVLTAACHKSKRQVEEIVATLRPLPPVPSTIRKLPVHTPAPVLDDMLQIGAIGSQVSASVVTRPEVCEAAPVPARRAAEIKPLAPEQYKVQFTASRDTYARLLEVQALLRHRIPSADVAAIMDLALAALLTELHRSKHAAVSHPRQQTTSAPRGRHVPSAVKRAVWDRDQGRCAFVGTLGRCS